MGYSVWIHGSYQSTRVLAHCAKILGDGVGICLETFGKVTADSSKMLRADYQRSRAHSSTDGGAEIEHISELQEQKASRVNNYSQRPSPLRTTAHIDGINSIAREFQGLASSKTLMAIADFFDANELPFDIESEPRFSAFLRPSGPPYTRRIFDKPEYYGASIRISSLELVVTSIAACLWLYTVGAATAATTTSATTNRNSDDASGDNDNDDNEISNQLPIRTQTS